MPGASLLDAANLAVQYRNGSIGIRNVSVTVRAGEVVAICGANGAGKTTTTRALTGVLRSEGIRIVKGGVRVDGRDITNREPHVLVAMGIYLIPERRKIFPNLSVLENLTSLGATLTRSIRAERLRRVYESFPVLEDRRNLAAGRLSGGQQQMLALGRALMVDARIMVIDEIALGLHPSLLRPLYDTVRAIVGEDRAAIIVNEDVHATAAFADRYIELSDGVVVGAT